jgi:GNAT superfamily N-acetyltransferase
MFTVLLQGDFEQEQYLRTFLQYIPKEMRDELNAPETIALGVADENNVAAGALISKMAGDWIEIIWLYIGDGFRNKGCGTLLLSDLISCVDSEDGIKGLFSQYPVFEGDEEETIAFYEQLFTKSGFESGDWESSGYSFTPADLKSSPFWQKTHSGAENVAVLDDVFDVTLREFEVKLLLASSSIALDFPVMWRQYDGQLSTAYIKNGEIKGVLLFEKKDSELQLSFAYVSPDEKAVLPALLYKSGKLIVDTLPEDTNISLAAITEVSVKLMEKLFENLTAQSTRYAVYRITEAAETAAEGGLS